MQNRARRFDSEAEILRCLLELLKQGFEFGQLAPELMKLGPVDLDLLQLVLAKAWQNATIGADGPNRSHEPGEPESAAPAEDSFRYLPAAG